MKKTVNFERYFEKQPIYFINLQGFLGDSMIKTNVSLSGFC